MASRSSTPSVTKRTTVRSQLRSSKRTAYPTAWPCTTHPAAPSGQRAHGRLTPLPAYGTTILHNTKGNLGRPRDLPGGSPFPPQPCQPPSSLRPSWAVYRQWLSAFSPLLPPDLVLGPPQADTVAPVYFSRCQSHPPRSCWHASSRSTKQHTRHTNV